MGFAPCSTKKVTCDQMQPSYWLRAFVDIRRCTCQKFQKLNNFSFFLLLDHVKIYNSQYLDPDYNAKSLQCKVQFDIRFYFARRGAENMDTMKRNTFKLQFDTRSEIWYVIKDIDELTKNHKDIDELVSGFMPENRDDHLCPVRSFRIYMEHLNPENDFLWQTPLEKINPKNAMIWYSKQHIGKNSLGNFMQDVSLNCKLSKSYTNHSIRVTSATVLMRMNFSASEIMSITGHKSVQSLTRYQKTQDKQKIEMGNVMHQAMTCEEDAIVVKRQRELENVCQQLALPYAQSDQNVNSPRTGVTPIQADLIQANKENVTDAIVPFEANLS